MAVMLVIDLVVVHVLVVQIYIIHWVVQQHCVPNVQVAQLVQEQLVNVHLAKLDIIYQIINV